MLETHLRDLDLNLLLALHLLLEERSVTRAAARLGRSQPAVSRSLARLREVLGDPLLVREGGALVPTPRAEVLAGALRQILTDIEGRVLAAEGFDPSRSRRAFTVATADYAGALFLPPLVAELAVEAPGVDLVCFPGNRPPVELAEQVDLVIGPLPGASSLRSRILHEDHFVVMVREDHPEVGDTLDLDTWCRLPHVLVAPRNTPGGTVDTALAAIGRQRRVAVRLPDFLAAPLLLARTPFVLTVPRRFAEHAARLHPVRLLEPPIPLPPFRMALSWLERWQHDPGHAWLRERLVRALAG